MTEKNRTMVGLAEQRRAGEDWAVDAILTREEAEQTEGWVDPIEERKDELDLTGWTSWASDVG